MFFRIVCCEKLKFFGWGIFFGWGKWVWLNVIKGYIKMEGIYSVYSMLNFYFWV